MASPDRPPTERERQILNLRRQGQSHSQIASAVGCAKSTVHETLKRIGDVPMHCMGTGGDQTMDVQGDKATFTGVTTTLIRSEEDAVREFKIDLTRWVVDRMQVKAWTVGMKVGDKEKGFKAEQQQQYGVTLWLKRVMPKLLQDATDAIFERMKSHAPKYPPVGRIPKNTRGESCMVVCMMADSHFGKMAWGLETGENYDLKIAEEVYRNGVEDLMLHWHGRPIDRILLPVGNDHLHVDNSRNTTYAGTPQDVDGRYAKLIEAGEMAVIWAVERLMQIAPVTVAWVPGNHDPTTSFHLARTVQAWFRRCDRVTVDVGPSPRKYFSWGTNLIGLTHGNEEKHESLPAIMATERPKEWAATTCREWLLGHMHRSRQWVTKPVDTHTGVTVRVVRSPASSDAWHHRKGYVGGIKACEAYLYGKESGYIGHAIAPVRHVEGN